MEELSETAQGTLFNKGDYEFVVADTYEDGNKSTLRLRIDADSLEMRRSGNSNATMQFKENASREAVYNTPYGTLCFEIETKKLDIVKSKDIKIRTEYLLKSNTEIVSSHELSIEII